MRMRRFYTFYGGMVEVIIRGYSLSCGNIWCSILVYHYLFAVCALLVSLVIFPFVGGLFLYAINTTDKKATCLFEELCFWCFKPQLLSGATVDFLLYTRNLKYRKS